MLYESIALPLSYVGWRAAPEGWTSISTALRADRGGLVRCRGRWDFERLPDLQLLWVLDVVGGHQIFGFDPKLLGNRRGIVACFHDVGLLPHGGARLGRRRRHNGNRRGCG